MEIPYKMKKKAEKQAKRWYELMGGANAKCGKDSVEEAAWDEILRIREKTKAIVEARNAKKYITKHDKNGDGKLDENDFK